MLIKAVLFDVDGTLVDSVDLHAQAWVDAFKEIGHDIPFDEMRAQIGKGGDQLLPVFLPPDELKEKGQALEKRRGEIFREGYLSQVRAFPQAAELLKHVDKAGLRSALASSASKEELAALRRIVGIEDDRLDAETSSSDAERSKPFPDIFEAALAQLPGISPDEAVVIGDTPYDAEAAAKAGIRTIGMLCGGFPEQSLRAAGCIAIYRDPAHLLAEYEASPLGAGGMPD
ncbi:HAD family hydrolase [Pseudoroseomonas wenyumeiae]|uniref:HAD family hydrolase n=1 Tax=Teichococcus wenyumeiae TaxID=2478470 RepID=A0A3A9J4L2_9PROT|nr:HAD family hydrolase [Pseudoroseomonas wenyumeiae]RKK02137.1 HAD family hydrolase [Pseudoroseomonas wenyumeiae]RMI17030.1 HAD family hydrolase [Pseudoroseomonas wenyumeiae]